MKIMENKLQSTTDINDVHDKYIMWTLINN